MTVKRDAGLGDGIAETLASSRQSFLGFVRRRVNDPELAEEILQDSLLQALRAAPHLRDEERLLPWFYRVLQNAITDAYRRRAVERRHIDLLEVEDRPLEAEEEAAICECFRELIPTLKPEYAELMQTLELEKVDPENMASRLGITPNNLKVRRHRARQALRKRLEETCRICAEHHCLDCTCRTG